MRRCSGWPGRLMVLCYIISSWTVEFSSASLLETIMYTQYEDRSTFCTDDAESLGAAFEGGEDYFRARFSDLEDQITVTTSTLREVDIQRRALEPSQTVINAIFVNMTNALNSKKIITESVEYIFGVDFGMQYCYKNGLKFSCRNEQQENEEDKERQEAYETPNPVWSYRYDCDGWRARLIHPDDLRSVGNKIYKIVVTVQLKLKDVDLSQCPGSPDVGFSGTALCNSSISQCEPVANLGFVVGAYRCLCTECLECDAINGTVLSDPAVDGEELLQAHCAEVKIRKSGESEDKVEIGKSGESEDKVKIGEGGESEEKSLLKANLAEVFALLAVEGLCVLLCLILAVIMLALRSSQAMRSARVVVLELILLGAVIRYVEIALVVLEPSELICLAQPWLAEVSFAFIYGAVILKTYSTLVREDSEGSRNRHPLYRSWLLALLFTLLYLGSWTDTSLRYLASRGGNITGVIEPDSVGIVHMQCLSANWGHITQAAESLLLVVGLYLTFVLKSPRSDFIESKCFAGAMAIELLFSILHHTLRAVSIADLKNLFLVHETNASDPIMLDWNEESVLAPTQYWMFILTFLYHQLTVTPVILIIICPKIHYGLKKTPLEGDEGTNLTDFKNNITANGDAKYTEANVAEMTPEDAKKELVKAHEQLHILKSKLMEYEKSTSQSEKLAHGSKNKYSKSGTSEAERQPLNAADNKNSEWVDF